jgi:ribosomal protein S18 acetylase RimI-like enzyme
MPAHEILVASRGRELKKIGAKALRNYFNPIIGEKARVTLEKKVTLAEERKYVLEQAKLLDKKLLLKIFLFVQGSIAGICDVRKGTLPSEAHNVTFGIALSRKWRGFGFGELLLRRAISEAKVRFRPKKMWLDRYGGNEIAGSLYRKVGFAEIARLKDFHSHYGKYEDKVIMEYRGK